MKPNKKKRIPSGGCNRPLKIPYDWEGIAATLFITFLGLCLITMFIKVWWLLIFSSY